MTDQPTSNLSPRRPAEVVFKLVALLILFVSFASAWLSLDYQAFSTKPLRLPDNGLTYTITPGTSLRQLATDLKQRDCIDKPYLLVLMAYLNRHAHDLKAGEYDLKSGMFPSDLLLLFASGKVRQHAFTIIEGWTFRQLREAIANDPILVHTLNGVDNSALMTRLGLPNMAPEGWFLPDTYLYQRGTTDFDFLQRAQRAMQKTLKAEWARRAPNLPYQEPYQALIMASIIEKETAEPTERPQIAGVFVRRLSQGMPLQTDPTIIYGLGTAYDGDIKRRDLTADGPYNTYLRVGLTPTPIAQPGIAALQAALHPAAGDSLYFVARGDGTHQFSATLAEHNKAVIRYQLKGKRPQANDAR